MLKQVYKRFPNNDRCIEFLEGVIWVDGPKCPYCGSLNYTLAKESKRYHCNTCNTSFSVTVNTIFHKTKIDLQKWFFAILLVYDYTSRISARNLGEVLEITKDSAWLMQKKIRKSIKENEVLFKKIIDKLK